MSDMKRLLSFARRACDEYDMIEEGDKIAVGVSGGKDSLALLYALAGLRRFYPKKFELCAITIDMGFEGTDFSPIKELCDKLGEDKITHIAGVKPHSMYSIPKIMWIKKYRTRYNLVLYFYLLVREYCI